MGKIKKVLITGAAGYVGRNLAQKLELNSNYELLLTDIVPYNKSNIYSKGTKFELMNLLDKKKIDLVINGFKPNIVIHLGANINRERNYSHFSELFQANVLGTLNLLNALKEIDYQTFIFASTGEVYSGSSSTPFKETDLVSPMSPYAVSKAAAEMLIINYSQIHNKPYCIARIFNIYGNDMPPSFFFRQLQDAFKKNVEFNMTYGEQKRDFIHISDVLDAFLLICTSSSQPLNEIFNLCTGRSISLKDIIQILKDKFKLNLEVNLGAIPYRINEVFDLTGDNSKLNNILGFKPKIDITEGLKKIFINY